MQANSLTSLLFCQAGEHQHIFQKAGKVESCAYLDCMPEHCDMPGAFIFVNTSRPFYDLCPLSIYSREVLWCTSFCPVLCDEDKSTYVK